MTRSWQSDNKRFYNLYLGDYVFNETSRTKDREGFGCFFFADPNRNKNNLQYYIGNVSKGYENGAGIFYDNGIVYTGTFVDRKIVSGKCSWPDKRIYTGSFKDFKMNGLGELKYANGKVENGYFEDGVYRKSRQEYEAEINRQEQIRINEERKQEELRLAEERKQEELRLAEEKRQERLKVVNEGKVYKISEADFSDNVGKYIGKIIMVPAGYTDAGNLGSWSDISGMTLRANGDNFEDIYSVYNFSYTLSDGASDNYRRRVTIDGRKINLIIPKRLSNEMPNTSRSLILIKGKVIDYKTIEVIQIVRN